MTSSKSGDAPFFPGFTRHGLTTDDGVDIHYVTGGSGPPLLLVHGAPQSHIMWRRVAQGLARHYSLIIPDLRGYGRSSKPARGDYTKRRMAADLIAIMDRHGHDRFRIAGHDRGARVTRRLIKDHEARIVKGAILDIVPTSYVYNNLTRDAAINMWNWSMWAAVEPVPETFLKPEAVVQGVNAMTNPEPEALADYLETNGNIEALHAMCEDYRAGASIDMEHDAADAARLIAVPLLILSGATSFSTSTVFDVEKAWRLEAADLAFGTIDSGHFIPEEAPEETLKALLAFMA